MNILNKTKNIIIVLIIVNLFLIWIYWFVSQKVSENTKRISDLSEELDLQLTREKQLKSFNDIVGDTTADRNKLDSYFVSPEGIVTFIEEIEGLALLAGLSVDIASVDVDEYFDSDKKSEIIESLNLGINTFGNWSDNFYFLNLLEGMPLNISVTRLNFDIRKNVVSKTLDWQGVIGLSVLKLK